MRWVTDYAGDASSMSTGPAASFYQLARLLGDYQAVKRGRVGRRVANEPLGRNVVRRLWR